MATYKLTVPISEEDIRKLTVGDQVLLNGIIVTGRDAAHKFLIENFIHGDPSKASKEDREVYERLKELLKGSVLYHCGPVVGQREDGTYYFVAAGPTTSIREEPYEAEVIEHFGLRGVIGKGGMGAKTLKALQDFGAVYFHAVGGAASLIANAVKEVVEVHKLEFGVPEAFWVIRVEDFPVVVTMDSHGNSIHNVVEEESKKKLEALLAG
jgi:fumarate hydratase subunit beta